MTWTKAGEAHLGQYRVHPPSFFSWKKCPPEGTPFALSAHNASKEALPLPPLHQEENILKRFLFN